MADQPIQAGDESGQARRFAEIEAKFAASEAARQATETALKQAAEQIARMQASERRKRFVEEVLGKGEQSATRWHGEPDKHVALLEKLADTFGDDSAEVRQYVEQNRAVAEALRQTSLFSEIGADSQGDANSPEAQLDAHARQYQAAHAGVSYEKAYAEVTTQHPEIQRRLVEAMRARR